MNLLIRWCKFNLVGVLGMGVQLTALALLNRCFHGHYLLASAAAVELTLLHNFLWHMHYTWRDRPTITQSPERLPLSPTHNHRHLDRRRASAPQWRDPCVRRCRCLFFAFKIACIPRKQTLHRLLRFHLSNGLVSLIGNVALMRLLVSQAHLPLLAANAIAILSCSIVNFLLSDAWAFRPSSSFANHNPSPLLGNPRL